MTKNPKFQKILSVFGRNQLYYKVKKFLKNTLTDSEVQKIKELIINALPFNTIYIRIFFIDENGDVEIYQSNSKRTKKLWQK